MDSENAKFEVKMIEQTEALHNFDHKDHRIIWCCYTYKASIDGRHYKERIRLEENIKHTQQYPTVNDSEVMFLRFKKEI